LRITNALSCSGYLLGHAGRGTWDNCPVFKKRGATPQVKEHGYPGSLREQAVKMYVDGLNYRRIGRLLGIDHRTVMLWVKAHADSLPNKAPVPQQVVVAEADELFTV
jgi:transposase-like protein